MHRRRFAGLTAEKPLGWSAVTIPDQTPAGPLGQVWTRPTASLQTPGCGWRSWRSRRAARDGPRHPLAEIFHDFAEALQVEMALLDDDGRVIAINAAWRAMNGAAGEGGEGAVGRDYLGVCLRFIPDLNTRAFRRGLADLLAGRTDTFTLSYPAPGAERARCRQLQIRPLRLSGRRCFAAVHSEVAARSGGRSQRSAEAVLAAQEQERQRIAMELHDSTSQHLVALGLGLARLRRLIGGASATETVLADMSRSVDAAMKEIRVLSYLMMPAGPQHEGLQATVAAFVKGFGSRTGLRTTFKAEGPVDDVSSAVKHAAFRVVQEALSNVYRHAQARGVEVEISRREAGLTVRIADDGKGIPSLRKGATSVTELGVGVAGMRARVAQLGGTLQITSDRGGAVVTAALPAFAAVSA